MIFGSVGTGCGVIVLKGCSPAMVAKPSRWRDLAVCHVTKTFEGVGRDGGMTTPRRCYHFSREAKPSLLFAWLILREARRAFSRLNLRQRHAGRRRAGTQQIGRQSRLSVPGRKALKKLVHIRNAWLNPTCITDAAERPFERMRLAAPGGLLLIARPCPHSRCRSCTSSPPPSPFRRSSCSWCRCRSPVSCFAVLLWRAHRRIMVLERDHAVVGTSGIDPLTTLPDRLRLRTGARDGRRRQRS